jgi:hypothetical protein
MDSRKRRAANPFNINNINRPNIYGQRLDNNISKQFDSIHNIKNRYPFHNEKNHILLRITMIKKNQNNHYISMLISELSI